MFNHLKYKIMNKCLITKLNGVVSNKNLTPLGCVALTVYPSDNTFKLECKGNNVEYFTANREAVFSTDKSNFVNRISANQAVFVKTNKPTLVFISNKYELTQVDVFDSAVKTQLDIDFNDFKYCKKVEKFNITNFRTLTGDISALSSLTSLQTLNLNDTSVSGDISALSSLTSLQTLSLNDTSVSGDISALSSLTSLQTLSMYGTSASGDISALSSLTSLQTLSLNNTSVSGDISALSSLTSLQKLSLNNTSASGDISALSSLTSLQTLSLNNTSASGDISALSSLTSLQTLSLNDTSASGDISVFNNMIELKILKMGSQGTGYFKTLCNSLKNNGKTSGTLTFWAYSGQIKIDNQTNCPNNDVIATFSEEGISYSGL